MVSRKTLYAGGLGIVIVGAIAISTAVIFTPEKETPYDVGYSCGVSNAKKVIANAHNISQEENENMAMKCIVKCAKTEDTFTCIEGVRDALIVSSSGL